MGNHIFQMYMLKLKMIPLSLLDGGAGGSRRRWELPRDPFDIIYNNTENIVESIEGFNFADFFYLIKSFGVIGGLLAIGATLLVMLYVERSDALADKKKDIEHKLFVLFLIFSLITIFNVMKEVFDNMFMV